jgi:hypothetical protein
VVIVHGDDTRRLHFRDVIFVVDDLVQPLGNLVLRGLLAADLAGYASVALPLMRTGVMAGVVEKNVQEVIHEINRAVKIFSDGSPVFLENIAIWVYDDRNG